MFILKTIRFSVEKDEFERWMRRSSLKRTTPLDFKSPVMDIGTDKLFLGYDGKSELQFTRLRTSFEKFIPRIIVIIPKEETNLYYKLRYSLLSSITCILFIALTLLVAATALMNKDNYEGILVPLILLCGFGLLTNLELKLVSKKINKALSSNE